MLKQLPLAQVCVLGDHKHCEEAKSLGVDAMSVEDLKKLNKNKKLVKKLGELPHSFLPQLHSTHLLVCSVPMLLSAPLLHHGCACKITDQPEAL